MLRSVRTLIFLHAVPVPLIKVLTDLEKRRDAFFYRHLGPHGPKEVPAAASRVVAPHPNRAHPVHPAHPGHPASDNRKKRATVKLWARLSGLAQHLKRQIPLQVRKDLNVYSTPAREECEGP